MSKLRHRQWNTRQVLIWSKYFTRSFLKITRSPLRYKLFGEAYFCFYRPHPKDGGRYCFQFVCQSTSQGGGGVAPSQVWLRGVPIPGLAGGGVPHPRSRWGRGSRSGWGTPLDLGWIPPPPGLGWGTPLDLGWGTHPPQTWDGVPPHDLGWGTPLPPDLGRGTPPRPGT